MSSYLQGELFLRLVGDQKAGTHRIPEKRDKIVKVGSCQCVTSDGTCTVTESLHILCSLIVVILRTGIKYDVLPMQPLGFYSFGI